MLKAVIYASNLSHLIPLFAGRKTKTLLWWYALAGLAFDLCRLCFNRFHLTLPGDANVFLMIEFVLVGLYFRNKLFKGDSWFFPYMLFVLLAFSAHTLWMRHWDPAKAFDRYRMNLEAGAFLYLHYIVFALLGLSRIIDRMETEALDKSPFFWANIAFLIYASGVFFIFLSEDHILTYDKRVMVLFWGYIFCSFNILKNLLLARSLKFEHGHHEA